MNEEQKKKTIDMWLCGMSLEQIRRILPVKVADFKATVREMKRTGEFPAKRTSKIERVKHAFDEGEVNPYKIAEENGIAYGTLKTYKTNLGLRTGRQKHNFKVCAKTKQIMSDLQKGEKSLSEIARTHQVPRQWVHELKTKLES